MLAPKKGSPGGGRCLEAGSYEDGLQGKTHLFRGSRKDVVFQLGCKETAVCIESAATEL